jgi:U4/U6 small nuclear ribonucleoprotein PRP31
MAINIVSSTTMGKPLNNKDLKSLLEACDNIIQLNKDKIEILNYIQTKMSIIAPNVCALVGSNVASKLITSSGGILELAKIPASNILVMGSTKINTEGFSTKGKLHMGYLADIEEVRKTPDDFKRQIMRRYSNKVALAARKDAFSENKNPSLTLNQTIDENNKEIGNYNIFIFYNI